MRDQTQLAAEIRADEAPAGQFTSERPWRRRRSAVVAIESVGGMPADAAEKLRRQLIARAQDAHILDLSQDFALIAKKQQFFSGEVKFILKVAEMHVRLNQIADLVETGKTVILLNYVYHVVASGIADGLAADWCNSVCALLPAPGLTIVIEGPGTITEVREMFNSAVCVAPFGGLVWLRIDGEFERARGCAAGVDTDSGGSFPKKSAKGPAKDRRRRKRCSLKCFSAVGAATLAVVLMAASIRLMSGGSGTDFDDDAADPVCPRTFYMAMKAAYARANNLEWSSVKRRGYVNVVDCALNGTSFKTWKCTRPRPTTGRSCRTRSGSSAATAPSAGPTWTNSFPGWPRAGTSSSPRRRVRRRRRRARRRVHRSRRLLRPRTAAGDAHRPAAARGNHLPASVATAPCVCVCAPLVYPEAVPDQQQRQSSDRPREEGEAEAQKFGQQARGSQIGRPPKKKAPIAERLATKDAVETIEMLSFVVATLSASSLAVFAVWFFRKGQRNGYCGGRDKGLPKQYGRTDRTGENSPSARQQRRQHRAELYEIVVGRRQRVPEPDGDPFDKTMHERAERRQQQQQVEQPGGARGGHEDSILPAKAEPRD